MIVATHQMSMGVNGKTLDKDGNMANEPNEVLGNEYSDGSMVNFDKGQELLHVAEHDTSFSNPSSTGLMSEKSSNERNPYPPSRIIQ